MSVDLGASDEVHTSPERTNPSTFYPRGIDVFNFYTGL